MNEFGSDCVACKCSIGHNPLFDIREYSDGTLEPFSYRQCAKCGTIQIASIPTNLDSFYNNASYQSFRQRSGKLGRTWLRSRVATVALALNTRSLTQFGLGFGPTWLRRSRLQLGDKILDVGCGIGENVLRLQLMGFNFVEGIDPHLASDTVPLAKGVRRGGYREIERSYDVIMLHHVLEHVPDPSAMIASLREKLRPNGRIIVRMPIVDSLAWRRYGTDWVQLDAPRHLAIFSAAGLEKFAASHELKIAAHKRDSSAFQFWGSELCAAGKPHHGADPAATNGFISGRRMAYYSAKSRWLNWRGQGDSVVVVLEPCS